MEAREYPSVVEELERAFKEEREAISNSDMNGISRCLSAVERLLAELLKAAGPENPHDKARILRWAARRREENALLLKAKMEEVGTEISRLRRGRKAAAAYSLRLQNGAGMAVDRDV